MKQRVDVDPRKYENLIGLNQTSKLAKSLRKTMPATDCEILNADIPVLDALHCCDHAALTCIQSENGELRVTRIVVTAETVDIDGLYGQFKGYKFSG
jgi:hypothetical protein